MSSSTEPVGLLFIEDDRLVVALNAKGAYTDTYEIAERAIDAAEKTAGYIISPKRDGDGKIPSLALWEHRNGYEDVFKALKTKYPISSFICQYYLVIDDVVIRTK